MDLGEVVRETLHSRNLERIENHTRAGNLPEATLRRAGRPLGVVRGAKLIVGRGFTSDRHVEADPLMSRQHFSVEYRSSYGWVTDLGSTNGTMVNGSRIDKAKVFTGDIVTAGATSFTVRLVDHPKRPDIDNNH